MDLNEAKYILEMPRFNDHFRDIRESIKNDDKEQLLEDLQQLEKAIKRNVEAQKAVLAAMSA